MRISIWYFQITSKNKTLSSLFYSRIKIKLNEKLLHYAQKNSQFLKDLIESFYQNI